MRARSTIAIIALFEAIAACGSSSQQTAGTSNESSGSPGASNSGAARARAQLRLPAGSPLRERPWDPRAKERPFPARTLPIRREAAAAVAVRRPVRPRRSTPDPGAASSRGWLHDPRGAGVQRVADRRVSPRPVHVDERNEDCQQERLDLPPRRDRSADAGLRAREEDAGDVDRHRLGLGHDRQHRDQRVERREVDSRSRPRSPSRRPARLRIRS